MEVELDARYTDATEPFRSQLKLFRKTHLPNVINSEGVEWTYLAGGAGDQVILVLHGGGPAESLFRYILALEADYRVIAPTIPASVSTVAGALGGILAILDREAVSVVHVFGVTNGGMVGQCLVRQCRQKVSTLILFHSMLPSAGYARLFGRRVKLLSVLPRWVIVTVGRRWLNRQIRAEAPNAVAGEQLFWISYFKELYKSELVTKKYFISRAKLLTDYFRNYRFDPHDLDDWPGRILIIESENDQVVNEHERERLKRIYADAKVHTFRGAGHLGGGLFKVEGTVRLLKNFFTSA